MNMILWVRWKHISEKSLKEMVQDGAAWADRSVIPEHRQEEKE